MKLESNLTDAQARELLAAYNTEPFHLEHASTVSQTMRAFALEIDPDNADFWAQVGLLHDLDYELYPDEHCVKEVGLLEEAGASPELIHAVASHGWGMTGSQHQPELEMEKVLYAVDELTGLIGAAILMRPSKSVMDFTVKSLKKKFKDPRFAAGVSRDTIRHGAEQLGWELDELFARTIAAMQSFAPDRETFQQS